jgi:cytoskeletal protein CcmA (bactofilin family)
MFNSKDKKGAVAAAPVPAAPATAPAPAVAATPVAAPAPAPVVVERSVPTNTISRGTSLQGNIETDANLRIEGRMKGDVKARSTFSVGEGAVVEGNISAEAAEIAGEIRGQVEVTTVLVLKSTAIVHGDILTDKFVVEAGAQFNGSCKMGQSAAPLRLPALSAANGRRPEAVASTN